MNNPGRGRRQLHFDENGQIGEDLACGHCGYNLRLNPPDGVCPECGNAISDSIHPDLLQLADRAYPKRLATGLMIYIVAAAINILLMILMEVSYLTGQDYKVTLVVYHISIVGIHWILVISTWMLTLPHPGAVTGSLAASARWGVSGSTLLQTLVRAIIVADMLSNRFSQTMYLSTQFCSIVLGLIWIASLLCLYLHLRQLSLQVPYSSGARHITIAGIGIVITNVCGYLFHVGFLIYISSGIFQSAGPDRAVYIALQGAGYITRAAVVIMTIWMIIAMFKLRAKIKVIAESPFFPPDPLPTNVIYRA